jgi:hypothetical protein
MKIKNLKIWRDIWFWTILIIMLIVRINIISVKSNTKQIIKDALRLRTS